jgi:CHAD domain-containing protein
VTPLLKTASKQRNSFCKAWNNVLRDANEDNVHEVRIASRRLLSSLLLVDSILLANHRSKARRKIKRVMRRLGPLRDVQVQISITSTWPRAKAPQAFREYLKRRKLATSRAALSYLTPKRKRAIREALKTTERNARHRFQAIKSAIVRARLTAAIEAQRAEVAASADAAKSKDPQKVHHFRVAGKRLRYALESANPDLPDKPDAEFRRLRRYQKDLGEKRDLALLTETLRSWRLKKTAG